MIGYVLTLRIFSAAPISYQVELAVAQPQVIHPALEAHRQDLEEQSVPHPVPAPRLRRPPLP